MCGICGGINLPTGAVLAMNASLEHRGPDDHGIFHAPPIELAMRRLSVIDLEGGAQPIFNEARNIAVVCNGEIYNFQTLRNELEGKGHRFGTRSDTETIVHAFEEWGNKCAEHLEGMFALAVCDARQEKPSLFLARDRMGIKPLYFCQNGSSFAFASEMRALQASGATRWALDHLAVWQHLAFQASVTPRTLVEGVKMLEPGHTISLGSSGSYSKTRYFNLMDSIEVHNPQPNLTAPAKNVSELLHQAVESHLIADVPVGVFLSGGIDSSSIASIAGQIGRQVHTFTVGFPKGHDKWDERSQAAAFARSINSQHTDIVVDEDKCVADVVNALKAMDHPSGDGINTFIVSGSVREAGFKVALSGLGADEIFGGYPSFRRMATHSNRNGVFRNTPFLVRLLAAKTLGVAFPRTIASDKIRGILETREPEKAFSILRQMFLEAERTRLFAEPWRSELAAAPDAIAEIAKPAFSKVGRTFTATSLAESQTYMQDVLLRDADQMSMAHGLELRVPFLDDKLVSYVLRLPDNSKQGHHGPKHLLKTAIAEFLPPASLRRQKKGFELPWERWLHGPLKTLAVDHISSLSKRTFFMEKPVLDVWRRFEARDRVMTWSRVWTLVALEAWLRRHLPDAGH